MCRQINITDLQVHHTEAEVGTEAKREEEAGIEAKRETEIEARRERGAGIEARKERERGIEKGIEVERETGIEEEKDPKETEVFLLLIEGMDSFLYVRFISSVSAEDVTWLV